jgi:hypothetical protein
MESANTPEKVASTSLFGVELSHPHRKIIFHLFKQLVGVENTFKWKISSSLLLAFVGYFLPFFLLAFCASVPRTERFPHWIEEANGTVAHSPRSLHPPLLVAISRRECG